MDTFKDGGRWLLLSKKDGQNYLTNGGSDLSIRICVKNGNLYRYQYYNNHNWKKNETMACVLYSAEVKNVDF